MNPVSKSRTYKMILVALFAALIAVGAKISFPLPVSSVPVTLQTLFVLLAGMLLGKKLGAASAVVYLIMGLIGIPVFAQGSVGFASIVLKPTFGYLIGFILGAYVTGALIQKFEKPTFWQLFLAALAGLLVIYLLGTVYFYLLKNIFFSEQVSVWWVVLNLFLVFVPGDILKILVAALIAKRMIPVLKKNNLS
jgi:biotin transport system substrate-specific component